MLSQSIGVRPDWAIIAKQALEASRSVMSKQ